ncbi:hypothetical protein AB8A21_16605 [Streptomyces sp. BF23-18]|uniref:DUF6083 domain-containing protein n=1 Tax=Streptomyces sp. BF23-18 TaxID=3240282 RepID=UPI0034E3EE7B
MKAEKWGRGYAIEAARACLDCGSRTGRPCAGSCSCCIPASCPTCGALVRVWPTNYDRRVSLATVELPAKDVPEPLRWRLTKLPARSHRHGHRRRTGPWSRSAPG